MHPTIRTAVLAAALLPIAGSALGQVTQNSVTVSWTAPGDDGTAGIAKQYDLRYSTSPITASSFGSLPRWMATPVPVTPGGAQSATVTGLLPGTTYHFAIKAADEVPNWSLISNTIARTTLATDLTRPAPVTTLEASAVAESSLILQWKAVGDDSLLGTASRYDLRYSTAPMTETSWATATQMSGEPTPAAPGTSQSIVVKGLARETTYYFAIRVIDDAGNVSALSTIVGLRTLDLTPPGTVQDLVTTP